MLIKDLPKVLIVEDDHSIRTMYEYKLTLSNINVCSAENGRIGLVSAEGFLPDLILLDLKMPEMSGDEMLIKLREKDWGRDIKVIILTNISKDEAPSLMRFMHVSRYVVKAHHTPKQVVEIVKEVLGIT